MAQENKETVNEMRQRAKDFDTLRPAPSDKKGYSEWAGRNGVKKESDPHYEKARQRGEVK